MRAHSKEYINGYDYAAGALLRGEETPKGIEDKVWDQSDFDKGAYDAINRLLFTHVDIEDDREY